MIKPIFLTKNYLISPIIKGNWQLAGGHGAISQKAALADMFAFAEAGITTFDCADIYTGVEETIGLFLDAYRKKYGELKATEIKVHTKFVPDKDKLGEITEEYVRSIIARSLKRLHKEKLDLVQFHWWDFAVPGCVEAMSYLNQLRKEGLIEHLGVTNFDVPHLQEIIKAGIPIVSNQVQFSVIDRRPIQAMHQFCKKEGIGLICYGTLAGGFISERYLNAPEPQEPLENRSLTKYKLIIDEAGGWNRFQELLRELYVIAQQANTTISTLASAYILNQKQVAGVIVGARTNEHILENVQIATLKLTPETIKKVDKAIRILEKLPGDIYSLERTDSRHVSIMQYNLNKKHHEKN